MKGLRKQFLLPCHLVCMAASTPNKPQNTNHLCAAVLTQQGRFSSALRAMPVFDVLSCSMLKDLKDMETLSELGVLFLLYEQGLELSLDRLKVSTAL
jgi:hypothetical protein